MVTTNIERLEGELNEVLNEFTSNQELNIDLAFNSNGNTFHYVVHCGEEKKEYSFKVEFTNELERKRVMKRYAKLSLYRYLSDRFSLKLPWGALTGIRPTKLYYQQGKK